MSAFLKTLQRAANDFRPKTPPRVGMVITLAQKQEHALGRAAAAIAVVLAVMIGCAFWLIHNEKAVVTVRPAAEAALKTKTAKAVKISAANQKKPSPAPAALPPDTASGIALSAESLSPPAADTMAPSPSGDPVIDVIAQKISDLPAIPDAAHSKPSVPPVTFQADAATDSQRLEDAHLLLESGDDQAALALYNHVLAGDRNNPAALAGKMYVLQRLGEAEAAVEVGHRLLQLDRHDSAARANLVTALGQSYAPSAVAELQRMVEADPRDAEAQAALGKILARRGYIEESFAHLSRASALAPGNVVYKLDLAILYDQASHSADALTLYRQVLRATADADEGVKLAISTQAIRQRVNYLEMAMAAAER